jgi:transposase InsO family protein
LDFISGLPKVGDLTSILVIIDRFSKYATFIPVPKTTSAEDTAKHFFKHIVKYWGLPQSIISDRDTRFTGTFWRELFRIMGSKLCMSSSYHPQSDGQTERYNSMLEEYLRHFANASQKNWVSLLDVAQFCYNSQKNSGTGKSAFEVVTGQQPCLPHTISSSEIGKCPRANNFSREWQQDIDLARSLLEKASARMKKQADKRRTYRNFVEGDQVMVKFIQHERRNLRGRDHRLLQKYDGPFKVVKKIGRSAYKIEPPTWWKIHPVFHVSLLKPFHPDDEDPARSTSHRPTLKLPPLPKRIAEDIIADRIITVSRKPRQQYLIKWEGQNPEENTWENEADLSAFPSLLTRYRRQLTRASTSPAGEDVTG